MSHPDNGIDNYGLSDEGVMQVKKSGAGDTRFDENLLIVSSDFKRARESAEILHRLLECNIAIRFDERLRERHFGELELSPDSSYAQVWQEDEIDPDNNLNGVESPNQVMQRVSALIAEFENKLSDTTLLLVSHGDALQILQTAFLKENASKHRQQPHLNTAEIRKLIFAAG